VSKMVRRADRRIRSNTARMMLTWAHYRFRMWLLYTAAKSASKVYVRSEAYTSKTCTKCGHIKDNLGGAKRYKCTSCGLNIDRDAAAARNIFMRNVLLTEVVAEGDPGGRTAQKNPKSRCVKGPTEAKKVTGKHSGIASLKPGSGGRGCKTPLSDEPTCSTPVYRSVITSGLPTSSSVPRADDVQPRAEGLPSETSVGKSTRMVRNRNRQ
jgi:predicted RNA-binding Zn-ribbon protein involved in translation (DUF1610 family)